jgi:hypothetical protein
MRNEARTARVGAKGTEAASTARHDADDAAQHVELPLRDFAVAVAKFVGETK